MSKVAQYLQEHLVGEVLVSSDARRYFSTDGSILSVMPAVIVYPQNENDVRKTARFTWQLAERGRVIPITARGLGTNQAGAAIGSGIILVFPAHLNRVLELDSKNGIVVVESGINYAKLQQTLHTHGRFLPPFPSSVEHSTIGGAIGNNTSGEKSVKYGDTAAYTRELRVVLANGEVIETKRLSKRELSKKLGLATFEGEVYRALDALLEENKELVASTKLAVSKNTAGFNLTDIKRKDGSFDLTPLIVGSQGTLGIVSEVVLDTKPYNGETTLVAAFLDNADLMQDVLLEIHKLPEPPSAVELIDSSVLRFLQANYPNQLKGLPEGTLPEQVLLIEFDDAQTRAQAKLAKKVEKILGKYDIKYRVETDDDAKEGLWKLRRASAVIATHHQGNVKAVPVIEDGIVPVERFREYMNAVAELCKRNHVSTAMWGHAGDGNIRIQPFLDLSQVGDRQKVFRLIDEYYKLVISLGGSTSGGHNDGRLRAAYLTQLYGEDAYNLFVKVKKIFDPYGTLNPGVKIANPGEELISILRSEYSVDHLYDHLPPA